MSKLLRSFSALLLSASLLGSQQLKAQLVGSEIFLKGDFVELGIATNGAYGTENDAPAGYHARSPFGISGRALGFVADPDKDGWTIGSPAYFGDYYLPGSPQEGWDMQYNGVWAQAWRGTSGTSLTGGLTGTCTNYTVTPDYKTGTWEGSLGVIKIKSVTKLKQNKVYFTNTVQLTNKSAVTIYNIYYNRTVDPDNEVETGGTAGGGYITDNKIVYKLPSTDNKTLVVGKGVDQGSYLGLGSRDCRARPYIIVGSLVPQDSLNIMFSGVGATKTVLKLDSLVKADFGIGVVFKIDSIKAGDSTLLSYAYILREADLDSAFEDLKPKFSFASQPFLSHDTARACEGTVVPIDILNGDFYEWTWSPATGLSTTKGTHVNLTVGSSPITYTATPAPNGLCPIDPITITVIPLPVPEKPTVVTPLYYCQYESALPLTATTLPGCTLRFYSTASGGIAATSLIPATLVAGSKFYYVSQVSAAGCESQRERIEIFVRKLPVLKFESKTDLTFCGATDGTITLSVDSANNVYTLTYDKDGKPESPITITADGFKKFTITDLAEGIYTNFVVTNKFGCKSAVFLGPVTIVNPAPPGPPLTNNGPLCVHETVLLSAPFITGATYSWTGPEGFTSTEQNPVFIATANSGGVYTLRVQVGICKHNPSFTTLTITPTPVNQKFQDLYTVCENTTLLVNIIKEAGISYLWNGKDISIADQALRIPNIQRNQSGEYVLTASTDNGCTTLDTINVQVDKRPTFAIVADTTICSVDSALLIVTSNAPQISWSPVNGLSDSNLFTILAQPKATTTYTAVAKSGNTCPDTSGKVKVTVIPTPEVLGYDTLVRMNIPYTILPVYGQEVIKWKWSPADSLSCSDCPNPVFNSSKPMTYFVYGTDKTGCTGRDTVTIRVFCDGANITMPNAFTPNKDGNNDIFYVRGTGFTVKSFSIYNRLGQLVFSKENFVPNDAQYGWDGTFNGQTVSDAAGFVYMLEAICRNSTNEPILIKGTVLMIK